MDKKELYNILVNELDYSEYEADITANDLLNLQPRFRPALEKWVSSREETNIAIGAISSAKLVRDKKFTYPAALIAVDWLATDPDTAVPILTSDIRQ